MITAKLHQPTCGCLCATGPRRPISASCFAGLGNIQRCVYALNIALSRSGSAAAQCEWMFTGYRMQRRIYPTTASDAHSKHGCAPQCSLLACSYGKRQCGDRYAGAGGSVRVGIRLITAGRKGAEGEHGKQKQTGVNVFRVGSSKSGFYDGPRDHLTLQGALTMSQPPAVKPPAGFTPVYLVPCYGFART